MFPANVAIVSCVSRWFVRTAGYILLARRHGVDDNGNPPVSEVFTVSRNEKRKSVDETDNQSAEELTQRAALGRFAQYTAPILLATLLSQGHGMAGTTVSVE
jgi:hypothetical protein